MPKGNSCRRAMVEKAICKSAQTPCAKSLPRTPFFGGFKRAERGAEVSPDGPAINVVSLKGDLGALFIDALIGQHSRSALASLNRQSIKSSANGS
jgi:hypothetical protein